MKVVYVDHDPEIRSYVAMILEASLNCEVLEFSSIPECVSYLEIDLPEDLVFVLSEIEISSHSAAELLDWFQDNLQRVPFIWISAIENKEKLITKQSLETGKASGFIPKPFKDDEFFPIIDKVFLDKAKMDKDDSVETDADKESRNVAETISAADAIEPDWDIDKKKKTNEEVDADWGLGGNKKKPASSEEADWEIGGKKTKSEAEEADWDISGKKTKQSTEEADWEIGGKKSQQAEEEADWGIGSDKEKKEAEEADWEIGAKGEAGEGDEADWEIGAKGEAGEGEEADWEIGSNGAEGEAVDADWEIGAKGNVRGEEEADWSLKKSRDQSSRRGYKSFKAKRLLSVDKMMADIYISLSEEKFLKIFSVDDPLEETRLQKYLDKGVEYLFIKDEEFSRFSEYFLGLVVDKLKKAGGAPVEIKSIAELAAFDNILATVKQVGITGATAEQIKDSIASNLETIDKMKSIKEIFSKVYRSQNYISEHSLMTSYIAGKIAMDTSWNSPQTIEKLSLACLLHDVSIEDNYLAQLHDLEIQEPGDFEEKYGSEIVEMIRNHPSKTAEMLTSGQHIFADVENIILQHHEAPDGNGYPAKLSSSTISPLSCLFIIAESYTHLLIKGEISDQEEIKKYFEKYNTGNFKTPLKSFFNVFTQV